MRGGFVACVGGDPGDLDRVVECLRWHRGKAVRDRRDGLEIAAFTDGADGPAIETRAGRTYVVHGAEPEPLAELRRRGGRFAAIEWDGRVLRAIRDPFSLAPLFYRVVEGRVFLATEVRPLVALGKPAPDLEALTCRTSFVPMDDRTGWQSIFRVIPGSTLTVGPDLEASSTLDWAPAARLGRYRGDRADALAEFRERFRTAVARCYEPGSGILLSGGLDSAAVALVAGASGGRRPHLAHVHFPDLPGTHEQHYARAVADAVGAGLDLVPGDVSPWDVDRELDGWGGIPYNWVPYGMEEPALAHLAAQGVRVALDGHDGDGVLGPTGSAWGDAILGGHLGHVGRLLRRHGPLRFARGAAVDLLPPYAWLRRLTGRGRRVTYMQEVAPYFSQPHQARMVGADIERWMWPSRRWPMRQLQPLLPRATISFEQKEIEAARYDIDLRHPFADRDLVDFLISLPSTLKADPGRTKALLVDSLGDLLPEALHVRPKSDYMAVVRRRVDPAACIQTIRDSGVRLPDIEYRRLFDDAQADSRRIPLFFLVNLTRVHAFVRQARSAPG
jgi:asparagine synthetase B (glutamine-hydrolysing)